MEKPHRRILFWMPFSLGILFVLFISLFALDVFAEAYGFWQTVLALLMHLRPTIFLIIVLILACRWALAGTVGF